MKSFLFRQTLLVLAASLAALSARAQATAFPPGQISYQGFITDANGIPLATNTPKNYTLNFRLWNAATGGSALWAEQQVVTVDRGYFTVMLGNGSAISGLTWTNDLTGFFRASDASSRYVGTTVTDISVAEIVPRLKLLTSPYSLLSSYALGASNVTGANVIGAGNLATNIGVWTVSGNNVARSGGNVGIDTVTPAVPLDLGAGLSPGSLKIALQNTGNQSTYFGLGMESGAMSFWASGSERMRLNSAGYLGIGTSTPSAPLDLGSAYGDRISLYNNSKYGIGVQNNLLQLHTDGASSDIVFGSGPSANFSEDMRVKGNGLVGIGTSAPLANLHVLSKISQNSVFDSASTAGTWTSLRNTGGGTNWNFVSTGGGNSEGAGKLIISAGPAINATGSENMVLAPNGRVGFGTSNPETLVDISGPNNGQLVLHNPGTLSDWYISAALDGTLLFYNGASENSAIISYEGVFSPVSNIRLQKNIKPIGKVLDKVLKLQGHSYHLIRQSDSEPKSLGYSAEEVQSLFPEVVTPSGDKFGIAYSQMVPIAMSAIQELNEKVEAKTQEVTALKAQVAALEAQQKELKTLVEKLAQTK